MGDLKRRGRGRRETDEADDINLRLFNAVRTDGLDVVKELVERGADPNWKNEDCHCTISLHNACTTGNLDVVKYLLQRARYARSLCH